MKKSILFLTALSLAFFSCSNDDEAKNEAPKVFEVTVESSSVTSESVEIIKGKSVVPEYEYTVTWTDAVDPEGDSVTYTVEIGGEEIDVEEKTAVISESDLEEGTDQTVTVTATDSEGASTSVINDFTRVTSKLVAH